MKVRSTSGMPRRDGLPHSPQHFIHYVPRRVVLRTPEDPTDPWLSVFQDTSDGFERPVCHVTGRLSGPAARVRPGDSIWLVGQLFSPWGVLPPAIDARIDVSRVGTDGKTLRFEADASSSWFPLADATSVLGKLRTVDARGTKRDMTVDDSTRIGHQLQGMRALQSATPLEHWAERLGSTQFEFVSYRLQDGSAAAFRLVETILRRGGIVFWDRWCLPRRLAERRERIDDAALDRYLLRHLRAARTVWGIESPGYFEADRYAHKEWCEALRAGNYRPAPE